MLHLMIGELTPTDVSAIAEQIEREAAQVPADEASDTFAAHVDAASARLRQEADRDQVARTRGYAIYSKQFPGWMERYSEAGRTAWATLVEPAEAEARDDSNALGRLAIAAARNDDARITKATTSLSNTFTGLYKSSLLNPRDAALQTLATAMPRASTPTVSNILAVDGTSILDAAAARAEPGVDVKALYAKAATGGRPGAMLTYIAALSGRSMDELNAMYRKQGAQGEAAALRVYTAVVNGTSMDELNAVARQTPYSNWAASILILAGATTGESMRVIHRMYDRFGHGTTGATLALAGAIKLRGTRLDPNDTALMIAAVLRAERDDVVLSP